MTREEAFELAEGVCPTCQTRYEDVHDAVRCDLFHRWPQYLRPPGDTRPVPDSWMAL